MSTKNAFKLIMYTLHVGGENVDKTILRKACKSLNHPLFSFEEVSKVPKQNCDLPACPLCSMAIEQVLSK